IAVVGLAGICISQAQSPSPAESPSPSQTPAKQRAMKKAKATPARRRTQSHHPHRGKFNLGDLFKPRTSAAANPAAASPAAPHGAATKPANSPAPGGGHGNVWVNTETHVYHKEGSRFYGTTKKGKYILRLRRSRKETKLGSINSATNRLW